MVQSGQEDTGRVPDRVADDRTISHFEVEGRSDEFFWYLKQALGQR
jgi:hypothetical protein